MIQILGTKDVILVLKLLLPLLEGIERTDIVKLICRQATL